MLTGAKHAVCSGSLVVYAKETRNNQWIYFIKVLFISERIPVYGIFNVQYAAHTDS